MAQPNEKPAPAPVAEEPKRIQVANFRGQYNAVLFDDDGISAIPVSTEFVAALKAQFPGAVITYPDATPVETPAV